MGERKSRNGRIGGEGGKLRTYTGTHRTLWGKDSDPLGYASYTEKKRNGER